MKSTHEALSSEVCTVNSNSSVSMTLNFMDTTCCVRLDTFSTLKCRKVLKDDALKSSCNPNKNVYALTTLYDINF